MKLPITPPYLPMEAQHADELPLGERWQYEPKWDGLRCLAFRDGDRIQLQSKSGKPLTQDLAEVVDSIRGLGAERFVLDGAIVVAADRANAALFVAFDLLVTERNTLLVNRMLVERRDRLETLAGKYFSDAAGVELSPRTQDADVAREWLTGIQIGIDGVVAKDIASRYLGGEQAGRSITDAPRAVAINARASARKASP